MEAHLPVLTMLGWVYDLHDILMCLLFLYRILIALASFIVEFFMSFCFVFDTLLSCVTIFLISCFVAYTLID